PWGVRALGRGQEAARRHSRGLPARTAYALVKVGELAEAVRALEAGQARLLTAALERDRADLEGLRQSHPALHEDYVRTAGRVALLEAGPLPPGDLDPAAEARAARAAREAAGRALRGVQGHETFLRPPTLEDVRSALPREEGSALLYLAATSAGALAILVTAATIERAWPGLTEDELVTLLAPPGAGRKGYLAGQLGNREELDGALPRILERAGERLVAPAAKRLRELGVRRVVLIPTGRLSLLPLHAARYRSGTKTTYFLDEFLVTYAPNART